MSAANHHVEAENTIRSWCMAMSDSVRNYDLDTHMALISENVLVYGVPGTQVIRYQDWLARRKFEFTNRELLFINYQDIRLINSTPKRLTFNTIETMIGKDGKLIVLDKNIVLENEHDGLWRVIEENVNKWQVKKINLDNLQN